jgi:hypothetical protein
MTINRHPRTLTSATGEDHEYLIHETPAEEGMDLFFELVAVSGDSVGQILDLVVKLAAQFKTGGHSILDVDLDGDSLGRALTGLATRLISKGGSKFVKRLMAHVVRDGSKFTEGKVPIGNQWCINAAFQANYLELVQLVVAVLDVNYSNLFSGPLSKLRELAALSPSPTSPGESNGLGTGPRP